MISKDKQYRTRDGHEVRIYATDGGNNKPVHGAMKLDEKWVIEEWTQYGECRDDCSNSRFDLIEVKPRIKRTVWVNIYPNDVNTVWSGKNAANGYALERIACVKVEIDCEEGEGI